MNYARIIKIFTLLMISIGVTACKSSDLQDVFRRCSPQCTDFVTPVPVETAQSNFEQVVETINVNNTNLDGRWVMLAVSHYAAKTSDLNVSGDLIFTKSMTFTDYSTQIKVSDCYQSETYALDVNGFTIPKDSVFFSNLPFDNQNDIVVTILSNKLLSADWTFLTPQDTEVNVTVKMYKVSDSNSPTMSLGEVGGNDIYCYSYLDLYTAGEQLYQGQWIPGEKETKEMLLKIDPASGDDNIALSSETNNGTTDYAIVFNQGISGQEYQCFGNNVITNSTSDFLSFEGNYDIQFTDSACMSFGGKSLGEKAFSFSAL